MLLKKNFVYAVVLFLFVISSCTPATTESWNGTSSLTPTIVETVSTPEGVSDHSIDRQVYFLLRGKKDPFFYRMVYVPVSCLIESMECADAQTVIDFPQKDYSPLSLTPLSWSPDGNLALYYNSFTGNLYSLATQDWISQMVNPNLNLIMDTIRWSPDDKWAAMAAQGKDVYSSNLVLYSPNTNNFWTLPIDSQGEKIPIGWKNVSQIIYLDVGYQEGSERLINQMTVMAFDITTHQYQKQLDIKNWNGDAFSLSPDGNHLAYSVLVNHVSRLEVLDLNDRSTKDLGAVGLMPAWSSDGTWVSTMLINDKKKDYRFFLTRLDGEEASKVFTVDSLPRLITWLPDNRHLLLLLDEPVNNLFVFSLFEGSAKPFMIPGIDQNLFQIDGISIR